MRKAFLNNRILKSSLSKMPEEASGNSSQYNTISNAPATNSNNRNNEDNDNKKGTLLERATRLLSDSFSASAQTLIGTKQPLSDDATKGKLLEEATQRLNNTDKLLSASSTSNNKRVHELNQQYYNRMAKRVKNLLDQK